jgi:hypothetical protein
VAPEATVLTHGNTEHLIANCDVLVTKYSSVVLVAAALGKEIVSDIPPQQLRRLTPLQNGGRSADRIAQECLSVLDASLLEAARS